jgi:hypothetical protein
VCAEQLPPQLPPKAAVRGPGSSSKIPQLAPDQGAKHLQLPPLQMPLRLQPSSLVQGTSPAATNGASSSSSSASSSGASGAIIPAGTYRRLHEGPYFSQKRDEI